MKVILANGTEIAPIMVTGGQNFVQGKSRDTLNFVFYSDHSIDELDNIFTAKNCESIKIIDGGEFVHKGYTLRSGLSKASVEVSKSTESGPAVYEDRITVSMSQRDYVETELSNIQDSLIQADETAIALYETCEQQESINAQQDEALMEIYEMLG